MISKDKVFKKAKKFDDTGIFGIGSDEMTEDEFNEYLKSKSSLLISQFPISIFMICYTFLGLWILSTPSLG